MLTWGIVIGFSVFGLVVYLFVLFQNREDNEQLLLNRLERLQLSNEKWEASLGAFANSNTEKKEELTQLLQEAKHFKEASKEMDERRPDLEREAQEWTAFDITEEEAVETYHEMKKERMTHV